MTASIPETIEGLPNLSGLDAEVQEATSRRRPVTLGRTPMRLDEIGAASGIALHMRRTPTPEDGDLRSARVAGNLEYMMEPKLAHGCHDAPAFLGCYSRIADFIRELVDAGRHPRIMPDYSGELLF